MVQDMKFIYVRSIGWRITNIESKLLNIIPDYMMEYVTWGKGYMGKSR